MAVGRKGKEGSRERQHGRRRLGGAGRDPAGSAQRPSIAPVGRHLWRCQSPCGPALGRVAGLPSPRGRLLRVAAACMSNCHHMKATLSPSPGRKERAPRSPRETRPPLFSPRLPASTWPRQPAAAAARPPCGRPGRPGHRHGRPCLLLRPGLRRCRRCRRSTAWPSSSCWRSRQCRA